MPEKINSYSGSTCSTASDGEASNSGVPPSDQGTKKAGTKRRASRAGTRSVSTLSAAQLARKRANDRDAQRAIRQRTKERVEDLERQVMELSAAKIDDPVMKAVQQRNKELERELSVLQSRMIQTPEHTPPHAQWSHAVPYFSESAMGGSIPVTSHEQLRLHDIPPEPRQTGHTSGPNNPLPAGRWAQAPNHFEPGLGAEQDELGLRSDAQTQRNWVSPSQAFDTGQIGFAPNTAYPPQTSFHPAALNHSNPSPFMAQPSLQAWELPICYLPPSNLVENLLVTVVHEQRNIAHGRISTRKHANARNLVYLGKRDTDDPISSTLTEILNNGHSMTQLAEKAAWLYLMHRLLRWQISPCLETYECMPEWFTPRPSQIVHPHPIWVSQVAHPKLRDKIISNPALYATESFQQLYLLSLRVNWPYTDLDVLVLQEGELRVSPLFEKHISRLENWSLGQPFSQRFPELSDVCRFSGA